MNKHIITSLNDYSTNGQDTIFIESKKFGCIIPVPCELFKKRLSVVDTSYLLHSGNSVDRYNTKYYPKEGYILLNTSNTRRPGNCGWRISLEAWKAVVRVIV